MTTTRSSDSSDIECAGEYAALDCFPWLFWAGANFETSPGPYDALPFNLVRAVDFTSITESNLPLNDWLSNPNLLQARINEKTCFVNLDLESKGWSVDFALDEKDSMYRHYCNLLEQIRECSPCAKVGSYNVFPITKTLSWRDDFGISGFDTRCYLTEQRANARLWCDKVDYLAPSFYVPYNDINPTWGSYDAWLTTMRITLRDAAIVSPDKPIYPFIWTIARFGPNPGMITRGMWQDILNMMRSLADGVFYFAYSVLEEKFEPGYTKNIKDSYWYQDILSNMQQTQMDCAAGNKKKRLRHEIPCPCLCNETITITLPQLARPVSLYQSAADNCVYGAGQDCTSQRAYVLEPFSFPDDDGTSSETLIEIKFDPAMCALSGEYVLNGSIVQKFSAFNPNNCWSHIAVNPSGSVTLS